MRTGGRLQVEIRDVYYIEAVLSGEAGSVGVCPFCIPVKKIRLGIPLNSPLREGQAMFVAASQI